MWRAWLKYETEFYILTPANLDRGNGLLWHNLVNRGNKGALRRNRRVLGRTPQRTHAKGGQNGWTD